MRTPCVACRAGDDNYCPRGVFTYNSRYKDGEPAYGGYQQRLRVSADFAFPIPDEMTSEHAAPLLCAGATVWSPLIQYGCGAGKRVAITGLGGLGHLAVMFASKLGAEVAVISHSKNKEKDARQFGAKLFIDSSDKKQCEDNKASFDLILVTAVYDGMDWDSIIQFGAIHSTVVLLAVPEEKVAFGAFSLLLRNVALAGSCIASTQTIRNMLAFAAKNRIAPVIEQFPMSRVNDALVHVRSGKVRYRAVLLPDDAAASGAKL